MSFVCPESGNPLMPSCRLVSDALSDYMEDMLADRDRLLLEEHLAACPLCLVYMNQFKRVYREAGAFDKSQLPEDFNAVMGKVLRRWQVDRDSRDS